MPKTDLSDMSILFLFTLLGFLLLLAHIVMIKHRQRRDKKKAAKLSREIIDYFRKTGVEVAAVSTNLQGDERFTALIESEPMKRFRLSHIIEFTLRNHIQKTCGLELECIYWRFPVKVGNQHVVPSSTDDGPETIIPALTGDRENKPMVSHDEYINEGLVPYKDMPKIEVTELSWDKFEEAATLEVEKKENAVAEPSAKE